MTDTDMIIVRYKEKRVIVEDYYSKGHANLAIDYVLGGTSDVQAISTSNRDGVMTAVVSRPLQTGDALDAVLYDGISTPFCYAYKESDFFEFHGQNFGFGTLKLTSEESEASFTRDPIYGKKFEQHGEKMTFLFLAVFPLAAILARYFKHFSYWFWGHFLLTSIAIYFCFSGIIARYEMNKSSGLAKNFDMRVHSRCGLTIGSLLIGQALLGLVSRFCVYWKTEAYLNMVVRRTHQVIGWSVILIAFLGMLKGWKLFDDSKLIYVQISIALLIFLILVLEINYRFGWARIQTVASLPEEKNLLVNPNPHPKIYRKMIKKGKLWSFYDEYLLDVSGFASSHPGGRKMIKHTIGQDLGKYLNGSSSIPPHNPFSHPQTALILAESLVIGKVNFASDLLVPQGLETYEHMSWKVLKKTMVCPTTFCIELENPNWRVKRPAGVAWMGKHFLVQGDKPHKRYYSLVVCDLEKWRAEAKQREYHTQNRKDVIRLYVKPYTLGKVSNHVTSLAVGETLILKGPMGPGLMIDELPNKPCLAFAGGTGILVFLDLVHAMWEEKVPANFKLFIYISFATNDDIFALDLLIALERRNPEIISCYLNIDLEAPNFLNKEGLLKWVDLSTVKLAWTCGTSGFNYWIKRMLKGVGFDTKSKLMVL